MNDDPRSQEALDVLKAILASSLRVEKLLQGRVSSPKPAQAQTKTYDCPVCKKPMVARANRSTGEQFFGCSAFPNCRGSRNASGEDSTKPDARRPLTTQSLTSELPLEPDEDVPF